MQQLQINCHLDVFSSLKELPEEERLLAEAAGKSRAGAYAPYSLFKVGAAVLLENGAVVTGNNQENAAYPSGLCAERVALFYAAAQYPGQKIKAIAVSAHVTENTDEPVAPCGACRQAMMEYEAKSGSGIKVIMSSKTGKAYRSASVANLLPLAFKAAALQ